MPAHTEIPAVATPYRDRYHQVGLSGNPFTVDPIEGSPSEVFVSRGFGSPPPPGSCHMVQIIGDPGAGKSTHLRQWQRQTDGPYHYIERRPYHLRWLRPPIADLTYGDEIDRMPQPLRWLWFRRLARRGATLVVGTHEDLADLARRTGFSSVTTHWIEPVDRATLGLMVASRLASASTDEDAASPRCLLTETDIDEAHTKSGGNPRQAWTVCHRLLAERVRSQ